MTNTSPKRDVAFLEKTARAMPNRDVSYRGVVVCFSALHRDFTYWQRFAGGSLTRLTRETAEQMMLEARS